MNGDKVSELKDMICQLRDLSYETGYIAGKIEAGVKYEDGIDKEYQKDKIYQRKLIYEMIMNIIDG